MVYALILLAVVGRLVPHPWNFTPVLAIALFGGAMLPRRVAWVIPVGALFISDLALGYPFGWMSLVVYGCLLVGVCLGRLLSSRRTWSRTIVATLAGSVLFFIVTNFAVWAGLGSYPHTASGLFHCYVMGLPFFRNSLAGDVCWTVGLFGLYDLANAYVRSRRLSNQHAA
jgi:hypothetical protein